MNGLTKALTHRSSRARVATIVNQVCVHCLLILGCGLPGTGPVCRVELLVAGFEIELNAMEELDWVFFFLFSCFMFFFPFCFLGSYLMARRGKKAINYIEALPALGKYIHILMGNRQRHSYVMI